MRAGPGIANRLGDKMRRIRIARGGFRLHIKNGPPIKTESVIGVLDGPTLPHTGFRDGVLLKEIPPGAVVDIPAKRLKQPVDKARARVRLAKRFGCVVGAVTVKLRHKGGDSGPTRLASLRAWRRLRAKRTG